MALECLKWRSYKVRWPSRFTYAKKDRNDSPCANQGLSIAEPRHGCAFFTMQVNPPTSPCPDPSANEEPISQDIAGSEIMMLKVLMKSLGRIIGANLTEQV